MPNRSLSERFHEKYITDPMSGCWLWVGGVDTRGYGQISEGGKMRRAHRISWQLHQGEIPVGMDILHKCDVPLCVNPSHLFFGTRTDNMRDCAAKGRNVRPDCNGEKSCHAKLNIADVVDIRTKRISQTQFAALYGVQRQAISKIQLGQTWKVVNA